MSELKKPDHAKRFVAFIIDVAIVAVLNLIPVAGSIVAVIYILVRDGLDFDFMNHASVGKQLVKLKPQTMEGAELDVNLSVKRNWPLAVGAATIVLAWIPFIGWILIPLAILASIVFGLVEVFLVLTDDEARRWGDKLAGTRVVELES